MTIKWKIMGKQRPEEGTNIVWRYPGQEGIGIGYYSFADAQDWEPHIEWIGQKELHALETMK